MLLMKILALDYGKRRVGLALGDTETRIAVGKGILEGLSQNKLITKIKAVVELEKIDRVLLGLPLTMAGQPTAVTEELQRFVEKLRNHVTVPVQTLDERFTSKLADTLLAEIPSSKRKQDQVAAQILLQNYLDKMVV